MNEAFEEDWNKKHETKTKKMWMTLILLVGWLFVVKWTRVTNLEKYNKNCPECFHVSYFIVLSMKRAHVKSCNLNLPATKSDCRVPQPIST